MPDAGLGLPARSLRRDALAVGGAAAGCRIASPAPPRLRLDPAGVVALDL